MISQLREALMEKYRAQGIPVEVFGAEGDDTTMDIGYDLEFVENRQGVSDVVPSVSGPIAFEFAEKTINIDVADIKIEWVAGSGFYPVSLEVTLDKSYNVVSTVLNFSYMDKSL